MGRCNRNIKAITRNVWEHVTYTVSPKGIVVYVDGTESARADVDITECFKDNFLANMKDVRFGSGNIWGDADIANAKFDDVAVFNTALSYKQVEALYNEGLPVEEPQVPVITVEKEELTLEVGESQKLNITVEPLDTVLTFVSSDENIATVSEEGVVSAKAVGEVSITVSAGDVSKVVKVTVKNKPSDDVITEPETLKNQQHQNNQGNRGLQNSQQILKRQNNQILQQLQNNLEILKTLDKQKLLWSHKFQ